MLDRLEPHSADVNAAGGAGAWEAGGGVYSAYLYLKVGAGLGVCWSSGWGGTRCGLFGPACMAGICNPCDEVAAGLFSQAHCLTALLPTTLPLTPLCPGAVRHPGSQQQPGGPRRSFLPRADGSSQPPGSHAAGCLRPLGPGRRGARGAAAAAAGCAPGWRRDAAGGLCPHVRWAASRASTAAL